MSSRTTLLLCLAAAGLLTVEAYLAAPVMGVLGPTEVTLKLPLLAMDAAAALPARSRPAVSTRCGASTGSPTSSVPLSGAPDRGAVDVHRIGHYARRAAARPSPLVTYRACPGGELLVPAIWLCPTPADLPPVY